MLSGIAGLFTVTHCPQMPSSVASKKSAPPATRQQAAAGKNGSGGGRRGGEGRPCPCLAANDRQFPHTEVFPTCKIHHTLILEHKIFRIWNTRPLHCHPLPCRCPQMPCSLASKKSTPAVTRQQAAAPAAGKNGKRGKGERGDLRPCPYLDAERKACRRSTCQRYRWWRSRRNVDLSGEQETGCSIDAC